MAIADYQYDFDDFVVVDPITKELLPGATVEIRPTVDGAPLEVADLQGTLVGTTLTASELGLVSAFRTTVDIVWVATGGVVIRKMLATRYQNALTYATAAQAAAGVSAAAAEAAQAAAEAAQSAVGSAVESGDGPVAFNILTVGTQTRAAVDGRVGALATPVDGLMLEASRRGLPSDGVTGASGAIAQTIAEAKAAARYVNVSTGATSGLPIIRIPKGRYRIDTTILLELLRGVTLQGDGMGTTVLYVDSGITLLDLHRVNQLKIKDMTLVASRGAANPGAVPWVDCLIENSCGVHIRERSDDGLAGVSTTDLTFDHVEWVGFHRAIRTSGNQMGDNVTFLGCKWRDNFYGVDSENGQAINWRVFGGEFIGFVDNGNNGEGPYNALLAGWSAASAPITAKPGQRQTPGDTASPLQNVTVRDGAVVRCMAGAGISFYNVSFISKNTRVLFGGLPTDVASASNVYGVDTNYMPFTFHHCSAEIRPTAFGGATVPEPGDTNGCDRLSLIRYEKPHPELGNKLLRSPVAFAHERLVVQAAAWDAVHLSNGMQVTWQSVQMAGAGAAGARVVSLLTATGSSAGNVGRFVAHDSSLLTRVKVGKQPNSLTAWTVPAGVAHDITQKGVVAGTDINNPSRTYDRTLLSGVTREQQYLSLQEADGTITQGTVRRLYMSKDAQLNRVRVLVTSAAAGAKPTIEFRRSSGVVVASLTVDLTSVGVVTLTGSGQKHDGCRAPHEDLYAVLGDGILDVVQVTTTAQPTIVTSAVGHVQIEFL